MNPAAELLLAYLRKAQERNAELQEQNRLLRIKVCQLRDSRDRWKARSMEKQKNVVLLRSRVYNARQRSEMWKHRAITSSGSSDSSGKSATSASEQNSESESTPRSW